MRLVMGTLRFAHPALLKREGIQAALAFAARMAHTKRIEPLAVSPSA
jgi:hypothetical protein